MAHVVIGLAISPYQPGLSRNCDGDFGSESGFEKSRWKGFSRILSPSTGEGSYPC